MARRIIYTDRIIHDIRSGLGDIPIMEKYQISPAEFMEILTKLQEVDAVQSEEIERLVTNLRKQSDVSEMRSTPRNYLVFTTSVYDAHDASISGVINDISESGLQVEGISVEVDESRSFVIRSDVFTVGAPITFDAECKWFRPSGPEGRHVAGFEITMISDSSLEQLRKLIQQLSLGDLS